MIGVANISARWEEYPDLCHEGDQAKEAPNKPHPSIAPAVEEEPSSEKATQ